MRYGSATAAAVCAPSLFAAGQVSAAAYTFAIIDAPAAPNYTSVSGDNDAGQVVEYYQDSTGDHGFLATPMAASVPEPASVALLGAGLLGLGLRRQRRNAVDGNLPSQLQGRRRHGDRRPGTFAFLGLTHAYAECDRLSG